MADSNTIDSATWAVVLATVAGPILAVQAQKAVEKFSGRKARRRAVFETLMATRGNRVAIDRVKALNMIDLTFDSNRASERNVVESWDAYRKHLNMDLKAQKLSLDQWSASGDELFYNLLYLISIDVGYKTKREQLKSSNYSPIGHSQATEEENQIRQNAVRVLNGTQSLKFEMTAQQDLLKDQALLRENMLKALNGGVLSVEIKKE
jgi:hypothetical protein